MGCLYSKTVLKQTAAANCDHEDALILASETNFTASEVESLYDLYQRLSYLIFNDGLIHKEDFQFALFRDSKKKNLFADRIFDMFDVKRNGVIEFGEFVKSLSVFHPNSPEEEKMEFAFRLYDLRHTGFIEHDELKEMVLALLDESDLCLSDDTVEKIVSQTFTQVDLNGDGKIDPDEWKDFVKKNPSLMRNMTLPYLKDMTLDFPNFTMNCKTNGKELIDLKQHTSCYNLS